MEKRESKLRKDQKILTCFIEKLNVTDNNDDQDKISKRTRKKSMSLVKLIKDSLKRDGSLICDEDELDKKTDVSGNVSRKLNRTQYQDRSLSKIMSKTRHEMSNEITSTRKNLIHNDDGLKSSIYTKETEFRNTMFSKEHGYQDSICNRENDFFFPPNNTSVPFSDLKLKEYKRATMGNPREPLKVLRQNNFQNEKIERFEKLENQSFFDTDRHDDLLLHEKGTNRHDDKENTKLTYSLSNIHQKENNRQKESKRLSSITQRVEEVLVRNPKKASNDEGYFPKENSRVTNNVFSSIEKNTNCDTDDQYHKRNCYVD